METLNALHQSIQLTKMRFLNTALLIHQRATAPASHLSTLQSAKFLTTLLFVQLNIRNT